MNDNLRKNFIWNIIGLSFNAFNSLFFLIVVKYFNGISEAGVFTYAFSLCALLYVLGCFYTRTYQIANYGNNKDINDFLSFRLVSCIICLLVGIVFCIINRFDLFKSLVIVVILLFRLLEAFSDCLYGQIQDKGRLYNVGISMFVKSLLSIIILIVLEILTHNLLIALLGIVVVNILVIVSYDRKNFNEVKGKIKLKFDTKNFKLIIKESAPIFIFTFLLIYMANSQKYVLTYYVPNDMQTIFGILIMPSTMLSLIGNYLIMPFLTDLNKDIKEKEYTKFLNKTHLILLIMFGIGVVITIATYFIGIPVLNVIYQIDLAPYKMELLIIVFASVISAITIMFSNYMILVNKNVIQVILYSIIAVITTALNIIFISSNGINGAANAYLVSYIILFVLYFVSYEYSIYKLKVGK